MDQIAQLLQALAQQLGITVAQLWPYLVRYTYAKHLGNLVVDIAELLIFVVFIVYGSKLIRGSYNKEMGESAPSKYFFAVVAGLILMFFSVVGISVALSDIPTQFAAVISPEAQAIYDVIAQLSTKVK